MLVTEIERLAVLEIDVGRLEGVEWYRWFINLTGIDVLACYECGPPV